MTIRTVSLPGGETVGALGQGTWMMGQSASARAAEIEALRLGLDLGMTLIDTAEMYGDGESEKLVGEALANRREEAFIVSKAYPYNAGRRSLPQACEASLKRLGTDRLDLYLLHWRGSIPLAETVEAMEALCAAGKIRHWGVSNFDVGDMRELERAGGTGCAANQVLYNLTRRGVEYDLLPSLAEAGIAAMAYSPVEQGRLPNAGPLNAVAARHDASPFQIAIAWVLRLPGVIAIPKAGSADHVRDNAAARDIVLSDDDVAELDEAFPPPQRKTRLEML